MDRLSAMLAAQYEQQLEIHGPLPASAAARQELAQHFALRLMGEVSEYTSASGCAGAWPGREALPRSTRVTELVDVLKYTLALCWAEGVTAKELFEAFSAKTRLVATRHRTQLLSHKIAGFDLDGVLCEYGTWSPSEREFIERGGALQLKPLPGAKALLDWLKAEGWDILVVTARKAHIYKRLEADTLDWLTAHDMPVDRVLFGYDKMAHIHGYTGLIRFFVDDSPKHALDVANGGIPVFHLTNGTIGLTHPRIHNIECTSDLRAAIEGLYGY